MQPRHVRAEEDVPDVEKIMSMGNVIMNNQNVVTVVAITVWLMEDVK